MVEPSEQEILEMERKQDAYKLAVLLYDIYQENKLKDKHDDQDEW